MILLSGRITNRPQVAKAMGFAPDNFKRGILGALLTERNLFVGGKNKDGVFTKKIMRKVSLRGEKWPRNIARIFGGRVDNADHLDGMRLIMGVGESSRSKYHHRYGYGVGLYSGVPFMDVVDFLSTGGSVVPKEHEFMIMPVYRNFPNKKTIRKQWMLMRDNDLLEFVREGNRIYYFRKNGFGDERDLLFIGIKAATIRSQYDFYSDWNKRLPSTFQRIGRRIDRITERINRG